MKKLKTNRTIVVEGKYDAVKIHAIAEANIITIDGFAIYSDQQKQTMLKRLAQKNGLILWLDADGAGFRMRHYLTNLVGESHVLQLYTPAIKGKEKRKESAGKEGLLGVEGIQTDTLYQILETALKTDASSNKKYDVGLDHAASTTTSPNSNDCKQMITYTDLFRWKLSGCEGSSVRKIAFLQSLELPPRLSKKELVAVLNRLYTYDEIEEKVIAFFADTVVK